MSWNTECVEIYSDIDSVADDSPSTRSGTFTEGQSARDRNFRDVAAA